ncbi:MAG: hypothetical protein ACLFPA_08070 [Dichotomicrobium sp.]
MTRLLGLAALGLAFAVSPVMAQTTCEREGRVVLDRAQPNEPADRLEANTPDDITVSRFLVIPTDDCNFGPQASDMQLVQTETQDGSLN